MKLQQLRSLIALYKCGNLQDASERVFLTRSAVSRSIRELESELNTELFCRSSKGMVLNEQGRRLIGFAYNILDGVERASQQFREPECPRQGGLEVAVTPITSTLPPLAQTCSDRCLHPKPINVHEMAVEDAIDRLGRELIDFAITGTVVCCPPHIERLSVGWLSCTLARYAVMNATALDEPPVIEFTDCRLAREGWQPNADPIRCESMGMALSLAMSTDMVVAVPTTLLEDGCVFSSLQPADGMDSVADIEINILNKKDRPFGEEALAFIDDFRRNFKKWMCAN